MIEILLENLKYRINELDHQLNLGIIEEDEHGKLLLQCEKELRGLEDEILNCN